MPACLSMLSFLDSISIMKNSSCMRNFNQLRSQISVSNNSEDFSNSNDSNDVTNTALSQLLVSLNYSLCADQIYISVHSFIAFRKSSFSHSYFESLCHYRVSESSYIDHHHIERCIEAFLCYFHNKW